MTNTKTETKTESKIDKTTPKNIANYNKAVSLGKELSKDPEMTKAEVARRMYDLIKDESREVISMAFQEGARITPKGSDDICGQHPEKVTEKVQTTHLPEGQWRGRVSKNLNLCFLILD